MGRLGSALERWRSTSGGDVDTRRLVVGFLVVLVLSFVGAGVLVLRDELTDESEAHVPSAWEVAWEYVTALDDRKASAAAKLTDDPAAARSMLTETFEELPDAAVTALLGEVNDKDDSATGAFEVTWKFGEGRTFRYQNTVDLVKVDGRWRVRWSPAVVHPELRAGERLAVVSNSNSPAVVDADGVPLVRWQAGGPLAVKPSRARLLQPGMVNQALERGAPGDWAVAAVTGKGKGQTRRLLRGDGPANVIPLRSTLSVRAQDAAQAAVDSIKDPAALVAIRPSTGGIIAVAQNDAASIGPIALSGLYPPGSTFKIVTATAVMAAGAVNAESVVPCPGSANVGARTIVNDEKFDLGDVPLRTAFAKSCNTTFGQLARTLSPGALVSAANQLGVNSDFDIPGTATEAGAVRPSTDVSQRVEDAIGQGQVHASPFGVALMSATVAAGKPVTPTLWSDRRTKVIKSYPAPPEPIIAALRAMMRETVTAGTATRLRDLGEVYGKTGTAQAGGGTAHGWFTGYRDDLAFAVLVEDAGSSESAVRLTAKFLDAL